MTSLKYAAMLLSLAHGGEAAINLANHYLGITTSAEPFNLHLPSQSEASQKGFIFSHVIGCFESKLYSIIELMSLRAN